MRLVILPPVFRWAELGDTMNSGYDYLTGTSEGGPLSDPGTILLNSVSFTAGVNATAPQNYPNQYSIVETLTIGSNSQQITIPFSLDISYSDTVTIAGGTTFSFLDGGSLWQVVLNGLTLGPNPGGTMSGLLTAQVSDPVPQTPLPAALPLFASGLGGIVSLPGGGGGGTVRQPPPNCRYISWSKELTARQLRSRRLLYFGRASPKVVLAFTAVGQDLQSSPHQKTL